MVNVIKAKAKDLDKFLEFFERTLKEKYFLYLAENAPYIINAGLPKKPQFKKEILNGERPLYLIHKKTRIIGYLLTKENYAGIAFGHWLAVDKDFQNKGYATELLKVWEQDSFEHGAHAIQLWTTENDAGFYKKNGFVSGGKFEKAWFGLDHYLFYKIIGKPSPKKYI